MYKARRPAVATSTDKTVQQAMMWPVKLALAISFVVFVVTGHNKHKRVPVMDGFVSTSGYLAETLSRSTIQCAYTCTRLGGSKSLFHVQKSGICQCHSNLFYEHSISVSNLTSVEGAKYYESKGWKLDCPYYNHTFQDVELPDGTTFQYKVFFDTWLTFNESVAKCAEEGSRVLQVTSPEKFEFIVQLAECLIAGMDPNYYYEPIYWIDGVYKGDSTNITATGWETMAGDPLSQNPDYWYLDYQSHWIDRWNTSRESLCLLSVEVKGYDARWHFYPCNDRYYTICEKV